MGESTPPNPSSAMLWFFILTTVYFTLKYYTLSGPSDAKSAQSQGMVQFGVYILLLVVGEFFINLGLTEAMCGNNQWGTALTVTLIPWVVIFGILNLMLLVFPGWLAPFSNTFGYGVAWLAGLPDLMDKIFKDKLENPTDDKRTRDMKEALAHIYSDKSLLINEVTKSNFDTFWENMSGTFKAAAKTPNTAANPLRQALFHMITLKDIVSEFVWFILTGMLVTSVGYNYIVNTGCKQSMAEMKKRHDDYTSKEEIIHQSKQDGAAPRIYSTQE